MIVNSAGGVVFKDRKILLLKKRNGDWVLPKGRIEEDETSSEAAIREVKEETNETANVVSDLGSTSYSFSNYWTEYKKIDKTVTWYLMRGYLSVLKPQLEEGFIDVKYINIDDVLSIACYDDEKKVIKKAIIEIEKLL